jgi:hypothetical protein
MAMAFIWTHAIFISVDAPNLVFLASYIFDWHGPYQAMEMAAAYLCILAEYHCI